MRRDTRPLDPQRRSLHAILRAHLPAFLRAHALPAFVRDELSGYLDCGVLARGCARYECDGCHLVRVTALSCKGRGFCPRCIGRRMNETARDLVTRVLPHVRIRQRTQSQPFALRTRLAFITAPRSHCGAWRSARSIAATDGSRARRASPSAIVYLCRRIAPRCASPRLSLSLSAT